MATSGVHSFPGQRPAPDRSRGRPSYEILEWIGEGAFGTVYRARQSSTGQEVAIKVLRAGLGGSPADSRRRDRFRREMELCARLRHPHIVHLLDSGCDGEGNPFTVFEFVEGSTMADQLRISGPPPAPLVKILMTQILQALDYAHRQGIVHRDLKPANIMIRLEHDQALAKVLDFGVGAFLPDVVDAVQRLTSTADLIGTPSYAAPELLLGQKAGPSTDLYSWGLVFLECLTGRPAIHGSSIPEIIQQQLRSDDITLPPEIASHPVGALIRRVLAKKPCKRVADASRILEELGRLHLDDLVCRYTPEGPGGRNDRPDRMKTSEGPLADVEIRPLTVACVRMEARGEPRDAEEAERMDERLRHLRTLALDLAARYGGHSMGNLGWFSLFGFGIRNPTGQEARVAARFLTDLLEENAISDIRPGCAESTAELEFRAGLHAGAARRERCSALAESLEDVAIRICQLAPPGRIALSAAARDCVARHLRTEPLAAAPDVDKNVFLLSGRAAPMADGEPCRDGLIGRDEELYRLEGIWSESAAGKARAVCVVGEAGIGKSSIVAAVAARAGRDGAAVVLGRCQPENVNKALHPVFDLLRGDLGLPPATDRETLAKRIGLALEDAGATAEAGVVLGQWLSLPLADDRQAEIPTPGARRRLLFEGLERILLGRHSRPRILVLEDLHWADPTTLEFLLHLVPRWKGEAGLLLLSGRPELDPAVSRSMESIRLSSLSERDSMRLLERCLGGRRISRSLGQRLVERAGGLPLHLESLVQAVTQGAPVDAADLDDINAAPVMARIPPDLMGLLGSQVDKAGPATETARLGAVLGREWDERSLSELTMLRDEALHADLEGLLDAGILVRRNDAEGAVYSFRHDLLRDATYASLSTAARVDLHGRIAAMLERKGCREAGDALELARHFAGALRFEQAIPLGISAARELLDRSSFVEAARVSLSVLQWMDKAGLGAPPESRQAIHVAMTHALMGIRGWADPSVKEQIELSRRLMDRIGAGPHWAATLCSLMTFHYVASNRAELACVAEELGRYAEQTGEMGLRIASSTFLGLWAHGAGRYPQARRDFLFVLDNYRPELHSDHGAKFGLDTRIWSAATLALVEWFLGDPRQSMRLADRAVEWAHDLRHVPSLGIALLYRANLCHYRGDRTELRRSVDELCGLADSHDLPAFLAYGKILSAWLEDDAEKAQERLEALERMGCTAALSYYRSLLAEILLRQGRIEAAARCLETCLALCEANDEAYYQVPLWNLHGRCLEQLGPSRFKQARRSFGIARRLARKAGIRIPAIPATERPSESVS